MLTIRREQMEAFSQAAVRRFERDVLRDLRVGYPARFGRMGEAAVTGLVREAIKRCAPYGVTAERDVAQVAELDFLHGQPFERQKGFEWAGAILRDESIVPGARVALVVSRQPETTANP